MLKNLSAQVFTVPSTKIYPLIINLPMVLKCQTLKLTLHMYVPVYVYMYKCLVCIILCLYAALMIVSLVCAIL